MELSDAAKQKIPARIILDLGVMAELVGLGNSLANAWDFILQHESDEEAKAFFLAMKHNWETLPENAAFRVAPVFEPYAESSEEWLMFYAMSKTGEMSGMLDRSWKIAIMAVFLKRKLARRSADVIDIALLSPLLPCLREQGADVDFRKWSASPLWPQELPFTKICDAKVLEGAYLLWLLARSKETSSVAEVPGYFVEEVRRIADFADTAENAELAEKAIRDMYSVSYLLD